MPVRFVNFSKSRLIFILFFFLSMFVTNFLHISRTRISKRKRCFNVKSSTSCFHVKAKILTDFEICISVPLIYLNFLQCWIKMGRYHKAMILYANFLNFFQIKSLFTKKFRKCQKRSHNVHDWGVFVASNLNNNFFSFSCLIKFTNAANSR